MVVNNWTVCVEAVTLSCGCVALTGEQVSDLFDEVAQLLIALLHSLSAVVGFDQHLQRVSLGLICPVVGLPHLPTHTHTRQKG